MFLRIKRIYGQEYAYLVENSWEKKGPRQKVIGYIGKVYRFDREKKDFILDISRMIYPEIVRLFAGWMVEQYGFVQEGMEFVKDGIVLDISTMTLRKKGKDVVIKSSEGYICTQTLQALLSFNGVGDEEEVGYGLARAFVDAGIDMPKEKFLQVFERVHKGE